jgi:multisubunit Na+/H+ antiporter MnhC subunit
MCMTCYLRVHARALNMFYGNYNSVTLLQFCVYLFFLISSLYVLKDEHSRQIYAIWYINSFFFLLFLGMGVVAEKRNIHLVEVCGSYKDTCEMLYEYLTNTDDEIAVVLILTALAIGPQVLTYILSGLSGSASPPKFVGTVAKLALWSFVKFIAGFGGIITAEPFAKLAAGKPASPINFVAGFAITSLAFSYAAGYVQITEKFPRFLRKRFGDPDSLKQPLVTIHKFFTRHTREETSADRAQDSALPII